MNATIHDLQQVEAVLRAELAAVLTRGWRRHEVRHALRKRVHREGLRLVDELDLGVVRWARTSSLSPTGALAVATRVRHYISALPALAPVVDTSAASSEAVVGKVRGLLAKAESTTFPAEAAALTAKAHELMSRHAIDEMLVSGEVSSDAIEQRRMLIADPYAKPRFILLSEIARSSGCRAVWAEGFGHATLFGTGAALDGVALLYTSLSAQAVTALGRESTGASGSTLAAYRRAFLLSFARRIGQRLRVSRQACVDALAEEHGASLLPVLKEHDSAVDAAVEAAMGQLGSMRTTASNPQGWINGARAGERASLANVVPFPSMPRSIGRGDLP